MIITITDCLKNLLEFDFNHYMEFIDCFKQLTLHSYIKRYLLFKCFF